MAKRKIMVVDNPNERRILRAKAKKVSRYDSYLERLVEDLWETMRAAPGVGLAAPQIGESLRVMVAEYEDQAVAMVNPEVTKRSEEEELGTEGCLSIPGYVGDDVSRPVAVTIKARDPKGKEIRVKAEGWYARVLLHEIDHLDGVLYTDLIPAEKIRKVTAEDMEPEGGAPAEHDGAGAAKKSHARRSPAPAASGGQS